MNELEKCRQRLLKHYRKIIAECEQTLRDIASWNQNRTDCQPMDPEPWTVMLDLSRKILRQVEANERIDERLYQRLLDVAGSD